MYTCTSVELLSMNGLRKATISSQSLQISSGAVGFGLGT